MTLQVKNFDSPDETRPLVSNGKVDVVHVGDVTVGRTVFEPGWRWSEHVKPIAGTDSCQSNHAGYCISGRMKVVMDDGEEAEIGPGEAFAISPGHDAWIVGDETFVGVDFSGMAHYAKA
jgi:quercetin dioxygenase-like cupin family protein